MKVKLALDWTPNTIHSGFFVAEQNAYFTKENIELEIIHPGMDNYEKTPARKLANGEVDFCVAPSESVISYQLSENKKDLVAIAAILQRDKSAIVSLKNSGIEKPAELDGKIYGSYQARYEDGIIRQMIMNDGGYGQVQITYPEKLKIWDLLLAQKIDATWIFEPWEGVLAEEKGIELNYFHLENYQIPYGYSPLIICRKETLENEPEKVKAFLKACAKGYVFVHNNKADAAKILVKTGIEAFKDESFNLKSLLKFKNAFLNEHWFWGVMDRNKWEIFLSFLFENALLQNHKGEQIDPNTIEIDQFFTNDFITRNIIV